MLLFYDLNRLTFTFTGKPFLVFGHGHYEVPNKEGISFFDVLLQEIKLCFYQVQLVTKMHHLRSLIRASNFQEWKRLPFDQTDLITSLRIIKLEAVS